MVGRLSSCICTPTSPANASYTSKVCALDSLTHLQVTENQQGADGAKPADGAATGQPTAAQQTAAAAIPAAGAAPPVEPPEEEKYTVHVPEGLTYFDLDLIKMTAQFVARNGKGFLTGAVH